jgi:hypothetical protein
MIRVLEARFVRDHVVWLRFNDGSDGEVDLSDRLYGPVFEPLKGSEYFQSFEVHPELHTIVWPNGADFAPEFLRDRVRVAA